MEQVPPTPAGAPDEALQLAQSGSAEPRPDAGVDPDASAPVVGWDAAPAGSPPTGPLLDGGGVAAPASGVVAVFAPPVAPRRSRGATVAIWILGVALALALAACAWGAVQFVLAQDRITQQQDRIREQQDEIEQQKELIDKKETFGAAMTGLMDTAARFDGVLMASIVPWGAYESLAHRGWTHRWDATAMDRDIDRVDAARAELETALGAAHAEAASNATGTAYESVIDELGRGFVRSIVDEKYCGTGDDGILGCVAGDDPYLVHFDAAGNAEPFMTDELRIGVAYHEFAHVLQFTNPDATAATLPAFGGDDEFMADCFALTFLDGWKLDHRVWTSSYEYWDVSIGYGRTCDAAQQQAVRDWYAQLGVRLQEVSS